MRQRTFLIWAACLLGCLPAAQSQSPWARSRAGVFAQMAYQTIPSYTALFGSSADHDLLLPREVSEQTVQVYGEYGLSRKTTLVGAVPMNFMRRGGINPDAPAGSTQAGRLSNFGNVQLAVRHQLLNRRWAVSGTLRLGLPAAAQQPATGLRTGYDAFTLLPMLSAGRGFRQAYAYAYAGYALRTEGYSHYVQAGAEAGYHLRRVWLIGFTELIKSAENGRLQAPPREVLTGLYVNDQGYWSLGLKTLVELGRFWGLSASAAGAGWGKYVPKQPAFSVGAYFKWD